MGKWGFKALPNRWIKVTAPSRQPLGKGADREQIWFSSLAVAVIWSDEKWQIFLFYHPTIF